MLISKKIILVYYLGKLPGYSKYFISSCKSNPDFDFVIFNNFTKENRQEGNVRFVKSDLGAFNLRATTALGLRVEIDRGFKICDLRPTFGVLFQDYIKGYEYWGYCDLDTILGNLNNFLNEENLLEADVISTKPLWNSGSFSLFRNSERVNNVFRLTDDWKVVFTSNHYYGFDECGSRWDGNPRSVGSGEILSLYDLIHLPQSGLTCIYNDWVVEWPEDFTKLKWNKGQWIDVQTGKEFMYLHLLLMKNSWRFYKPEHLDFSKEIFVTGLGLSIGDHTKLSLSSVNWRFRRAVSCCLGIAQSLKTKVKRWAL